MVNARKGVGYMVEAARKVLDFDRVYAGIIAIGVAAFLFRWLLTVAERRLFPWRRAMVQSSAPAIAKVAAKRTRMRGKRDWPRMNTDDKNGKRTGLALVLFRSRKRAPSRRAAQ